MSTLLADSYLHGLDPFALHISGDFGLRWYGLSYAVGFLIGWWMIRRMAKTGRSSLTVEAVGDFMFYVIAGVLLGGRIGYVVFYDPSLLGFSATFPFWDLLAINKGGMASHGGIAGVIIACCVYAWRRKVGSLHLLDLVAFACPPGLGLGRIANFINGELWGRSLPASMQDHPPWWSIKYPREITEVWQKSIVKPKLFSPEVVAEAPRQLASLESLRDNVPPVGDFHQQIIAAAYAGKASVLQELPPLLTAYYPSQLIQALSDGPILGGVLALIWLKPRRPGLVGAWFLLTYGVLRVITEVFREPDLGVDRLLGLSRGQVLSVLLILAGVISIIICSRRNVEPMGGLVRPGPLRPKPLRPAGT